ncbi:hypothetical protein BDW75DRAFT_218332 [Aspergillus navahoensis]
MRNIKLYGRRHRLPCRQGLEDGKSFCIALHKLRKLEHTCLFLCRGERRPGSLVGGFGRGHSGINVGCTSGVGFVGDGSFVVGVYNCEAA